MSKNKAIKRNKSLAIIRSRELRAKATEPERKVIKELIKRGIEFEFQRPFWSEFAIYIVDFYIKGINGKNYVIEIDGHSHDNSKSYDKNRSVFLYKRGCIVKRFTNKEVHQDIGKVVDQICLIQPKPRNEDPKVIPEGLKGNGNYKKENEEYWTKRKKRFPKKDKPIPITLKRYLQKHPYLK